MCSYHPKKTVRAGQFVFRITYSIIALFVLILLGGILLNHAHSINQAASIIKTHHLSFMVWRYLAMVAFIFFYPVIVQSIFLKAMHEGVDEVTLKFSKRRYAVLFCILYELIIVQNLLSPLINWFLSR